MSIKRDLFEAGTDVVHLLQSQFIVNKYKHRLQQHLDETKGQSLQYSLSSNGHGAFQTYVLTTRIPSEGTQKDEIRAWHINFSKDGSKETSKKVLQDTRDFLATLNPPIVPLWDLHDGFLFDLSVKTQVLPFQHFVRDLFFWLKNVALTYRTAGDGDDIETPTVWMGPIFEAAFKFDADDDYAKLYDPTFSANVETFTTLFSARLLSDRSKMQYHFDLDLFDEDSLKNVKKNIIRLMPNVTNIEKACLKKEEQNRQFDPPRYPSNGYTCLGGTRKESGAVDCDGMLRIAENVWAMLSFIWDRRVGLVLPEATAAAVKAMKSLIAVIKRCDPKIMTDATWSSVPSKDLLLRCLELYSSALEKPATRSGFCWEIIDLFPDYELSLTTRFAIDVNVIVERLREGALYADGYESWCGKTDQLVRFVAMLPGYSEDELKKALIKFFNAEGREIDARPKDKSKKKK